MKAGAWFYIVVGAGMAIGFGSLSVSGARELISFPDEPVKISLDEAAIAQEGLPWIELVGVTADCSIGYPERSRRSAHYVLIGDRRRMIVALERWIACEELPTLLQGTLDVRMLDDLPADLGDLEWPADRISILWTSGGPADSWSMIAIGGAFGGLGLLIMWFGITALRRKDASKDAIASPSIILPKDVLLSLEPSHRARRTGVVCIAAGIPWAAVWLSTLAAVEDSLIAWLGLLLLAGVGLFFGWVGVMAWRNAGRLAADRGPFELGWLPVIGADKQIESGVFTGTTFYTLEVQRDSHTIQVSTSPIDSGLIFRDESRSSVLAAMAMHPIAVRSDLAELELDESVRSQLLASLQPATGEAM